MRESQLHGSKKRKERQGDCEILIGCRPKWISGVNGRGEVGDRVQYNVTQSRSGCRTSCEKRTGLEPDDDGNLSGSCQ